MTDLYPATALSFFTLFPPSFSLSCSHYVFHFQRGRLSWLARHSSPISLFFCFFLLFSFGCSKIHPINSPGSHVVNLPCSFSSVVNGVPWSSEGPRRNSHTFNCRMLVNPHSESQDEPHEHEPQQQKYETMQCFAVSEPKSIKEEGDGMEGETRLVLGSVETLNCLHSYGDIYDFDHLIF